MAPARSLRLSLPSSGRAPNRVNCLRRWRVHHTRHIRAVFAASKFWRFDCFLCVSRCPAISIRIRSAQQRRNKKKSPRSLPRLNLSAQMRSTAEDSHQVVFERKGKIAKDPDRLASRAPSPVDCRFRRRPVSFPCPGMWQSARATTSRFPLLHTPGELFEHRFPLIPPGTFDKSCLHAERATIFNHRLSAVAIRRIRADDCMEPLASASARLFFKKWFASPFCIGIAA